MKTILLCSVAFFLALGACNAAPTVTNAYYRADQPFPQFQTYWKATSDVKGADADAELGGVVQVFFQNTTTEPITLTDVSLEGISLSKAITLKREKKYRHYVYAASVHWSPLLPKDIETLRKVGDPIWWRFDPKVLKPGAFGELVVRLRHKPAADKVALSIHAAGTEDLSVSVTVAKESPRFEAIRLTPGSELAYVYTKHPNYVGAPQKVELNGVDVTGDCNMFSDSKVSVAPIVCKLKKPLEIGDLCYFHAVYPDGSIASALVRAFDNEFAFGMWGSRASEGPDPKSAKHHLSDLAGHNINVQMPMIGSAAVAEYMKTEEGHKAMASMGIRRAIEEPGKAGTKNPWAYFLADEPDAGDAHVVGLPDGAPQLGSLGQGLVERTQELREADPKTPGLLNINYTFRPHNYYTYGQLPDILGSDPYYQARLGQEAEQGKAPEKINAFKKATYIEGVTTLCQSAQAPKPVHIILLAGGGRDAGIPYATPQEKRIETFYAIGAGAQGISYWWFKGLASGLDPNPTHPGAVAQWNELGLLGAELRTAGPIITTSCPASYKVEGPPNLWVRSLVRGSDTLVLVCVNDDYAVNLNGIEIKPLPDVRLRMTLPSWLKPQDVFEVNHSGTKDVPCTFMGSMGTMVAGITLGQMDVTRLIFITSDPNLRDALQTRYEENFANNTAKLVGTEPEGSGN